MQENKEFYESLSRIAVKYAGLVEKRVDSVSEPSCDLADIHDDIRLLGNITSCLNSFRNPINHS